MLYQNSLSKQQVYKCRPLWDHREELFNKSFALVEINGTVEWNGIKVQITS